MGLSIEGKLTSQLNIFLILEINSLPDLLVEVYFRKYNIEGIFDAFTYIIVFVSQILFHA